MRWYRYAAMGVTLALGILSIASCGCQTIKPTPTATLRVIPEKTVLSPALIKKPVQFQGSGFAPKEMVVVEMVLPPGLKLKGIEEGEDVGLAFAKADEKGNIQAAMAPTATLNWFFQVGWTPNMKPDFKQAKPLPPGKYTIRATGMDSGIVGQAVLEILPPPKKKS